MRRQSKRHRRPPRSTGKPTHRHLSLVPLFEPLEPRELLSSVDPLLLGLADEPAQTAASEPAIYASAADADEGAGAAAGVGTNAATQPIPNLRLWEQNMLSYGAIHGDTSKEYNTWEGYPWYYDGEWAFYQIADYTRDDSWNASAEHIEDTYRSYVLENNGQVTGWRVFPHGLYEDFLRTGDEESKRAVLLLATRSAYAHLGGGELFTRSRETAYAMQAYMYAEKLGAPRHEKLSVALEFALGHMDQWFVSKTVTHMKPFMVGLTAHALIEYNEMYGDERIQPLLEKAADWLWENAWAETNQSFYYESYAPYDPAAKPERGVPDLNMLIAPMYGWLFNQTQDVTYLERGDAAFAGGVEGAYLTGGKQFTQSYRLSFLYVEWRQDVQVGTWTSPQIAEPSVSASDEPQAVTCSVTTLGDSWDATDDATLTTSLLSGQVSDALGALAASSVAGPGTITTGPATASARSMTFRLNHATDMSIDSVMPARSSIVSDWTNTGGSAGDDSEDWMMTADSNVGELRLGDVISADVEVGEPIDKSTAEEWADGAVEGVIGS